MYKIEGSFFEADLYLNEDLGTLEFQIYKNGDLSEKINIVDYLEIEEYLPQYLEKYNVVLPRNRLQTLLEKFEGLFMDLSHKRREIIAHNRVNNKTSQNLLADSVKSKKTKKIILMGLNGAGKTSIYKVIFEGVLPHETQKLSATRGVDRHQIDLDQILVNTEKTEKINLLKKFSPTHEENNLAIWDLGGQKSFLERYSKDPAMYFGEAACLIFIMDTFDIDRYEEARKEFFQAIDNFKEFGSKNQSSINPANQIYCFMHQMDHFPDKKDKFESLVRYFKQDPYYQQNTPPVHFYSTSIFDSSIFSAWTKVMQSLMPKSTKLNLISEQLKEELGLFVVFIIEKRTGLPIASSKTILDDAALVGSTNRILITIEKVLPEFNLSNMQEFHIATASGKLNIQIFGKYFILAMLYPSNISLHGEKAQNIIEKYKKLMHDSI